MSTNTPPERLLHHFLYSFLYYLHSGDPFSVFDETKRAKLLTHQNILTTQVYELCTTWQGFLSFRSAQSIYLFSESV